MAAPVLPAEPYPVALVNLDCQNPPVPAVPNVVPAAPQVQATNNVQAAVPEV